jgi:hypothetical protein
VWGGEEDNKAQGGQPLRKGWPKGGRGCKTQGDDLQERDDQD